MEKKIDIETIHSDHKGIKGIFEVLLRRFKLAMHIATMIPVYLFACVVLGACLVPAISFFRMVTELVVSHPTWLQNISYGLALAVGFFIYGVSLIFFLPVVNFLIGVKLKEWRGPYYSAESLKWFLHNGLTYLARFTFLEFITPSPLGNLFYQMMGMKIGKGVQINTTWISDPSLIEIGDKSTIGGSAAIMAHYGQGGLLIIAPVKIGIACTIGIKATIMGGVIVGDGAKLLPHSVLLPKTIVPPGEIWGGVPAQKVELRQVYSKDNSNKKESA